MPDTFVPLVSAVGSQRPSGFTSLNMKPASAAPSAPAKIEIPAPTSAANACGKPTVTLQRTGDIVSGIRVQCGCGQVVDLNCVY